MHSNVSRSTKLSNSIMYNTHSWQFSGTKSLIIRGSVTARSHVFDADHLIFWLGFLKNVFSSNSEGMSDCSFYPKSNCLILSFNMRIVKYLWFTKYVMSNFISYGTTPSNKSCMMSRGRFSATGIFSSSDGR